MKKLLAIFVAFTLILALAACGKGDATVGDVILSDSEGSADSLPSAQNDKEPTVETWYGLSRGLPLTLALSSDGTYTLSLAGEDKSGAWEEIGGEIRLDGEERASFLRLGDRLRMADGTFLGTQAPNLGVYTPAEVLTQGVTAATFNGYWTSAYVDVNGIPVPAGELGDDTDLVVEGERAALGGTLFGDVIVDMSFADGALSCKANSVTVTLQLQADGLMRLTLSGGSAGDMTIFLLPQYVEGLSPEPAEG